MKELDALKNNEVIMNIRHQAAEDAAKIGSTVAKQIDVFEQTTGATAYANLLRELHGISADNTSVL